MLTSLFAYVGTALVVLSLLFLAYVKCNPGFTEIFDPENKMSHFSVNALFVGAATLIELPLASTHSFSIAAIPPVLGLIICIIALLLTYRGPITRPVKERIKIGLTLVFGVWMMACGAIVGFITVV